LAAGFLASFWVKYFA
jgi:phospholipid-transporting ATPase